MAFNGRFVLNLIEIAAAKGLDKCELIAITKLTEQELLGEACKVESDAYDALNTFICSKKGFESFGLQSAEAMGLEASGIVGQITQNSKTVKEALEYCCEFANLGCSSLPMSLHKTNAGYKLEIVPDYQWLISSPETVRQTAEGLVAYTIKQFNQLTLSKDYPVKIDFIWDKPENVVDYEKPFKCPINFKKKTIAIYLSAQSVDREIKTSNYQLLRILVEHAYKKLETLSESNELEKTKRAVIKLADPFFPDIVETAKYIGLSKRTLQRRLQDFGFTYRQLVEDIRKEMAIIYLKDPQLSNKAISYLLGYSEVSAFNRSFKKWFNKTPNQFKNI